MTQRTQVFRGDRLRALRKAAALSQGQLGARIGAHTTSVSDWERGDNAPSGRHVASLSRELGVSAEHFYGDDADEEDHVARLRRVRAALVLNGHDDLAADLFEVAKAFPAERV